jgi:uncharacterized membrane protein YdbT with pleckstrin-like domain
MPYPRRLINQGEEVVLDLKPHWWYFAQQIGAGVALFVVLVLLWRWSGGNLETVSKWVWGLIALVWAVWLGIKFLDWQFTYFVVTTDRVIFRTGVLTKHGVEIPLTRVNNINFHQGIVDRLVGSGTLEIESAGENGESRFSHVRHPDAVQQEIYRQMEAHSRKRASWGRDDGAPLDTTPSTVAAGPSIPDQLRQLADLRDQGIISPAEFETKKAQLLERM